MPEEIRGKPKSETEENSEVQKRIEWLRHKYGLVPLVVEEMSKRSDIFVPYFEFSRLVLFEPKFLDSKTVELATIAAGSALASEHCLGIHLTQAKAAGASEEEIMESIMLGAYMAFTKSQAVSFRAYKSSKS